MKCYLCQKEMTKPGVQQVGAHHETCNNHKNIVVHKYGNITEVLLRVTFFVQIKGKDFEIILSPFEERTEINFIKKFPLPANPPPPPPAAGSRAWGNGSSFSVPTLIKRFDHLLDISPENAASKIKTIITFS